MAFEMSLLEVMTLAETDKKAASEAAEKLIVPLNSEDFTQDKLKAGYIDRNYGYFYRVPLDEIEQMPLNRHFIFDIFGHFFIHHGGLRLVAPEKIMMNAERVVDLMHNSDFHLISPHKNVLFNQRDKDNSGLVSIVLGLVYPWRMVGHYSRIGDEKSFIKSKTVADSFYIYAESGSNRMPVYFGPINGGRPLDTPILYFATQFPENAPIRKEGLHSKIGVLVPNTHSYNPNLLR